MNFDLTQRITGGLAILFLAWFASHSLHLHNEAKRVTAPALIAPATAPASSTVPTPIAATSIVERLGAHKPSDPLPSTANGEERALMPLVREASIPTKGLTINFGSREVLTANITRDFSRESSMFYGLLQSVSHAAFNAANKSMVMLPDSDIPKNEKDGARYISELFQYVLFRAIDLLQHSQTEYVSGTHTNGLHPPEASPYPSGDLAVAVRQNRFSAIGQEPVVWSGGWDVYAPKGTTILFMQNHLDSLVSPTYIIEFNNPSLYVMRFSSYVKTTYAPPEPGGEVYELLVKCYFEFKRNKDTDPLRQSEYEIWATGMFSALEKMLWR